MKLFGCVLLLLSSLWIGLLRVKKLRAKPIWLRELADSLLIVERESCVNFSPLPEAFLCAADSCRSTASFFRMICIGLEQKMLLLDVWRLAVNSLNVLTLEEKQMLYSLGSALGSGDIQLQRSALETCIAALQNQADTARYNAASEIRLTVGLSAVIGSILVILLC